MIPGYQILASLGRTASSSLYRGRRLEDGAAVLLRLFEGTSVQSDRLNDEYQLLQSLQIGNVARVSDFITASPPVFVLEDCAGKLLETCLTQRSPDVLGCLEVACAVAIALGTLHDARIVHQDLRPVNLLFGEQGAFFVDLTAATAGVDDFVPQLAPPADLAYASPEQTGHMNRPLDYRTDFYSFGVTFYRMLTGRLPFKANDALEWVHCHVARPPPPPQELNGSVPPVLSDICLKLLAKTPEDRYQSAQGLLSDLQHCRDALRTGGQLEAFPLGSTDLSNRLVIPHRLYGREKELDTLHAAFDRVAGGGRAELMLVSGYSGVGKSSLVQELSVPIIRAHGYFISGKFDQYRRNIPLETFIQAFSGLIRQLLAESESRIAQWRRRITGALGASGQLLVQFIPQLELIIGPQPPVPELPPLEAQQRFHRVLKDFVAVFAAPEHPLVMFLDDLQWVDSTSLGLIEELLEDGLIGQLLLIGAYRDNEVPASHPLRASVHRLQGAGIPARTIDLQPLLLEHVNRLIADTLQSDMDSLRELTSIVFQKTHGNPFFCNQFLLSLHDDGLLRLDPEQRRWTWELAQIKTKGYTDNVAELLAAKLQRLPADTRKVLQLAGCLGSTFELETLAAVAEQPAPQLRDALGGALREGMLLRSEGGTYRFLHDSIQEAAYSLIPQTERPGVYLRVGRLLTAKTPDERLPEHIFDILNAYNRGAELLTEQEERDRLAEMNLLAGRKAAAASAYGPASGYLAVGEAMLGADRWQRRYRLTFDLALESARSDWLSGRFEAAADRLTQLQEKAEGPVDLAEACRMKMLLHVTRGEYAAALAQLALAAPHVGIDLPLSPASDAQLQEEMERIWQCMQGRSIASLANLPELTDPEKRAAVALLSASLPASHFVDQNLHDFLCCQIIRLTVQQGNSEWSPHGYVNFGAMLGRRFSRWPDAYQFGRLAQELVEGEKIPHGKASAYFTIASFINFWVRPVREVLALFRKAFEVGRESGDLNHACYAAARIVECRLLAGDSLSDVAAEAQRQLDFTDRAGCLGPHQAVGYIHRLVRYLTGEITSLPAEEVEEADLLQRSPSANLRPLVQRVLVALLEEDFETGATNALRAREALAAGFRQIPLADYTFYGALALAAHYPAAPAARQAEYQRILADFRAQLQVWQVHCPDTFLSRYLLVSAEIARIENRDLEAMRLYEDAVNAARESGFVQNEAIGSEYAARFYRARGFDTIADAYLGKARACYTRWGALGKVRQLDNAYPHIRQAALSATMGVRQLDFLAVVQASQTISGEIELDRLIDTLMRIVLEYGGAQRASLLLLRDDDLCLAAEAQMGEQSLRVNLDPDWCPWGELPWSILNYVRRSRETVLLDEPRVPPQFAADPNLSPPRWKSALCLPLLRQQHLTGLLYLENRLTTYAFTPDRRMLLQLLASQAAISLETTHLYSALQRENAERRRAEEGLRASQGLLQAIIDNANAMIYVKDLEGHFLLVNRRFEEMTGVPRERAIGRTDDYLFPQDRAEHYSLKDQQVVESGVAREDEEVLYLDGEQRTLVSLKFPLFDQEGKVYAISGIATDITERKAAEEALRHIKEELETHVKERTIELLRANEALERSNLELQQFAFIAAHDLQTPLRSIRGFSQLLQKDYGGRFEPQADIWLGELVRATQRMYELIRDLLSFSRVESRGNTFQPVDCNELFDDVVKTLETPIREIDAQVTRDKLPIVTGDRTQLAQVLQNLIDNGLKYHSESPMVHVSARHVGNEWFFSVRDNGIGMDEKHLDKIFDIFRRLHTQDKYPGTGIGLAICRRVIHRHGGRIWAESEPGKGSVFYFTLPDHGDAAPT